MKMYFCDQGSPAWIALRYGIPTASEFSRIVTPGGKLSSQSRQYAMLLVTEKLLNRSLGSIDHLEWVSRGKELEPQAVKMYEFREDARTAKVGFITTENGEVGASPDRLVGENGLLEIKCPAPQTHVSYLLDGLDKDYRPQLQGQLFVSERDWVDWMSYSPEMPPALIRVPRDEPYIKMLSDALEEFCAIKNELLERARSMGMFAERAKLATELDEYAKRGALDEMIRLNEAAMRLHAP